MKIHPLREHVLIEPIEADSMSKGGIHLPDTAKEKPTKGKVLAVGSGAWHHGDKSHEPMPVAVGQTVYYSRYAGREIEEDGKKYLLLPISQLMAIVEEEPKSAEQFCSPEPPPSKE